MSQSKKILRLLLGDQLNHNHSWFAKVNPMITYVLMEVKSETDYVVHHIQKVVGFFAAMRCFAEELKIKGHHVVYLEIDNPQNLQRFDLNLQFLINKLNISKFEYQLPDEYRLDLMLLEFCKKLEIPYECFDTEHFYTSRYELSEIFKNKKKFLMESFYRTLRVKHKILMNGGEPLHGQWNFDSFNRNKIPPKHQITKPLLFKNNVLDIYNQIRGAGIKTIGEIEADNFFWPINRSQSLELLKFFNENCLLHFGTYQDAMQENQWSVYHSRLSFSLNTKMLSPKEVIESAVNYYYRNSDVIKYNQIEGFVRQIIGWREYMRGVYWNQMPQYSSKNYFNHQNNLPKWYWDGKTKMNCLNQCITQSLTKAYAHHIQRLMVTGNFALLAGINPDEVDNWYLGIYIDAIEWVEITNTRGMSQYADGGLLATKPYVSSASYINKMSNYCSNCYYDKDSKTGANACPFNSLYWHFIFRNQDKLRSNMRMNMMYAVWDKMKKDEQERIIMKAEQYLDKINTL